MVNSGGGALRLENYLLLASLPYREGSRMDI